ncbi:flagellar biosynthesis protein FlgE [Maritimibacter sp. 55A14]|uniref:flagellar hook protein FlgE n=1 Tax=Maritimibacter sp. 55A14 TaxID=2174844 RepID=UPI000D617ACF|nr:flagellar hook-basal body complex protein [Maritimibacter sp. 55A14]PWE33446.1 flagellar biosynthesis protein FlgE [Maritimibacter sp. 55A14]
MTISSSLNSSVAGLNVNATRLATISDNIANSGTFGYRRAVADFQSLVNGSVNGSFSAGGVRATTTRIVDQGGSLVTSNNPTDLAIGGRGFLPVTAASAVGNAGGPLPVMMTTTGSFRPDASGVLRTETGLVLLGVPASPDGTIPAFPRDSFDGLEPVRVSLNQFAGNPTTEVGLGLNLPATATEAGATGAPFDLSVEYFDNLGTSQSLDLTFTPAVPAAGSSNQWTLTLADSASGGAVVGEYTIDFDPNRASGGTIAAVTPVTGGPYDPATGLFTVNAAGGPIDVSIGQPGSPDGLTQLSDSFAPVSITKNGSPVGNLSGVEVDENGLLHAIYDSGFTRTIYRIPLVDVPNSNGLISLSNQTYQVSPESGASFLWNAGDGPVGDLIGFAREESATDVAGELTQLIQTQRAYSSNATVIQTVDEMLQETTNLKR